MHYYRWMQRKEGGLLFLIGLVVAGPALTTAGCGMQVLFCWLLPARLAMGLIAFSFSYFPHAPHKVTSREDRFRASNILLFPGLTLALLYQNYHLYPGVPFYRYARSFAAKREELLERGASVFPRHRR
jgi:fatty acid desaturase